MQTISAKAAAALDVELMSSGAFSIDQLMELAGLSVSQAGGPIILSCLHHMSSNPISSPSLSRSASQQGSTDPVGSAVPETMAGDPYPRHQHGLVLIRRSEVTASSPARHLRHYGYHPAVYYPKPGKNELYQVSGDTIH